MLEPPLPVDKLRGQDQPPGEEALEDLAGALRVAFEGALPVGEARGELAVDLRVRDGPPSRRVLDGAELVQDLLPTSFTRPHRLQDCREGVARPDRLGVAAQFALEPFALALEGEALLPRGQGTLRVEPLCELREAEPLGGQDEDAADDGGLLRVDLPHDMIAQGSAVRGGPRDLSIAVAVHDAAGDMPALRLPL